MPWMYVSPGFSLAKINSALIISCTARKSLSRETAHCVSAFVACWDAPEMSCEMEWSQVGPKVTLPGSEDDQYASAYASNHTLELL